MGCDLNMLLIFDGSDESLPGMDKMHSPGNLMTLQKKINLICFIWQIWTTDIISDDKWLQAHFSYLKYLDVGNIPGLKRPLAFNDVEYWRNVIFLNFENCQIKPNLFFCQPSIYRQSMGNHLVIVWLIQ